jgi:hypothetical protein
VCAPAACGRCGAGLAGARVTGVQKLQEFDITPAPPPRVTEYQVQARSCGRYGAVTAGQPPPGIPAGCNTARRCTPRPRTWPAPTMSRSPAPAS